MNEGRVGPTLPFRASPVRCAGSVTVPRGPSSLGHTARLWLVANRIDAEVRDDFSHVREMLLVELVSFW